MPRLLEQLVIKNPISHSMQKVRNISCHKGKTHDTNPAIPEVIPVERSEARKLLLRKVCAQWKV